MANRTDRDQAKEEIFGLWLQLRHWRYDLRQLDVRAPDRLWREQQGRDCPAANAENQERLDCLNLATAICDNSKRICRLAEPLHDAWADEKCESASSACRRWKVACCLCGEQPVSDRYRLPL